MRPAAACRLALPATPAPFAAIWFYKSIFLSGQSRFLGIAPYVCDRAFQILGRIDEFLIFVAAPDRMPRRYVRYISNCVSGFPPQLFDHRLGTISMPSNDQMGVIAHYRACETRIAFTQYDSSKLRRDPVPLSVVKPQNRILQLGLSSFQKGN